MARTKTHKTETATKLIFEEALTNFSDSSLNISEGDLLFRDIDERDYGVDGEVEIFKDGEVTGKLARIQIKGTEKEIVSLKKSDFVSCPGVSKSSLGYCRTRNIPFMLVYVSKKDGKFYYCDLQSVYQDALSKIGDGKSITIRIPIRNSSDHLERFVEIINDYYERPIDEGNMKTFERRVEKEKTDRNAQSEEYADNLWDYVDDVTDYEIDEYQTPADGEHKMVDSQGNIIKIGYWKDGELEKGTEYNHLIRVTKGFLVFKPGCDEDPYDASDDFEYEKLEMYHWEPLSPFHASEYYIAEVGMNNCYVVDMEVDGNTEQMVNIRPLEEFMASKDPRGLKDFKEMIDLDREDVLSAGLEMNAENYKDSTQVMEAVLRHRTAKLVTSNGSVTDVNYQALDLMKLFMEGNYGKSDTEPIAVALSRRALEKKPDKEMYWKCATVMNAVPGMIEKKEIQEIVNVLRAYKLIDCDKDGMLCVTEEGKKVTEEAIIMADKVKGNL